MKTNFFKSIFALFALVTLLCSCYIPRTGLYENDLGVRYYVKDVYQTGWQEIDSKTYYFSKEDGYMVTKSQSIAGQWYGFNSDGTLANGFLKDEDGVRYYENGIYKVRWQEIDEASYYFYTETGLMATGEVVIGNEKYTFSTDGKLLDSNG